jgi:hypothetical protein
MSKPPSPPSITATAFDCPHCGAFTTQHWYKLHADRIGENERVPSIPDSETRERIAKAKEFEPEQKERFLLWVDKILAGLILLDRNQNGAYVLLCGYTATCCFLVSASALPPTPIYPKNLSPTLKKLALL